MSETRKTVVIWVLALIALGAAVWAHFSRDREFDELAALRGKAFFPKFADPREVAEFEVISLDPATAKLRKLTVSRTNTGWRLTSHGGYPADVENRLARVAASLMGIKREALLSRRIADHSGFRVGDPLAELATPAESASRVTVRDRAGNVLADYLVGNRLSDSQIRARGFDPQSPLHTIRTPDSPAVWLAQLELNRLPSRFSDWIDADLLHLNADDPITLLLESFNVDEVAPSRAGDPPRLVIRGRERVFLGRDDPKEPWRMLGQPPGTEIDPVAVRGVLRALISLRIAGVHGRPAWLKPDMTPDFSVIEEEGAALDRARKELTRRVLRELRQKGFPYVNTANGPMFLPDAGRVMIRSQNGIEYSLSFGEVVTDARDLPKGKYRYLLVRTRFDATLLKPPPSGAPESEMQAFRKRLREQRAEAERLQKHFSDWFFIVRADTIGKLRVVRDDLLVPAAPRRPLIAPRPLSLSAR